MKNLYIIIISFFPYFLSGQFLTTWDTSLPGTSCSSCITIPTFGGGYSYNVDWENDGVIDDFGVSGDITHDYGTSGTYQVSITGSFPRIYFAFQNDRQKILSVDQWGNNPWSSLDRAFHGCSNLAGQANDEPNLSNVVVASNCFNSASSWDQDMSNWNVSSIQNFSSMFFNASSMNSDIGNWNVSSGTNFASMLRGCNSFNQDIGNWNMSNAVTIAGMFYSASSFNQDLNNWDVSNVNIMLSLFQSANSFNGDITGWDVGNVTNMESVFSSAGAFNQDIGGWDMSSATKTNFMFRLASSFNQDISGWDVSSVTNMSSMFVQASSFDQDIGGWDVSSVTNMSFMFGAVTLSTANYDAILIGWDAQSLQSGVNFHGGDSQYCAGEAARTNMINNDGWTITDDGEEPGCGAVIPMCTNLTSPLDGAINIDVTSSLNWAASVNADGYRMTLGTSSGGTDLLDDVDLGNVISYSPTTSFPCSSTIYVTITPYNTTGDATGCTEESFMTESVVASAGMDVSICESDNTQLNGSGGTSFSWSPTTGLDDPNIASPIASPTTTTTYILTTTNANGCSDTDDIIVTVDASPNATITGNLSICTGENTILDAGIFNTYAWSTGATSQTIDVNPIADTNYSVTVTDLNGCSNTASANVIVNSSPTVSTSATPNTICDGESTTLSATGAGGQTPFAFTWDNGLGAGDNFTIQPSVTTTYSVTITDANGCTNTDMSIVTVNPLPSPSISGMLTICAGESTTLDAGSFDSYTWSSGETSQSIMVNSLVDTDYSVTVTDATGCTNSDVVSVVVNQLPLPNITGNPIICFGENTTLDAGAFDSYLWSLGQTTQTIAIAPGIDFIYGVTVTDANGCTNTDEIQIIVNPVPEVEATTIANMICLGESTIIEAVGMGGNGPYDFSWDNGLGNGDSFTVEPLSTTTYTVTITDDNGCSETDMVTITVNPLPEPTITGNFMICIGEDAVLDAGLFDNYNWSNGENTQAISVSPSDDTDYFVTVTDGNGCSNIGEVTVVVNELPAPSITGNLTICEGESTELDAGNFSFYDWSNGETTSSITVNPSADADYSVTVTDANGCTNTDGITVLVNEVPEVEAVAESSDICLGGSTIIEADGFGGTGPYTYFWDNGLGDGIDFDVEPTITTTYTVTVTDDNGCMNTAMVTVTVNDLPSPSIQGLLTICSGDETTLDAGNYSAYEWSTGETTESIIVNPADDTDYSVTVTDANGCSDTDEITVFVNSIPSPTITGNLTVCNGVSSVLDAGSFSFYDWSDGETSQTITVNPTVDTDYSVTVTDINGCTNTDLVTVIVNEFLLVETSATLNSLCLGQSTMIQASGFGGVAPYSYMWDNGLGSGEIFNVQPTSTTSYSVTMTDSEGCTNSDLITITVNDIPSPIIIGNLNVCESEGTNLEVGSFSSYAWSTGETTQLINVNPSSNSNYTVTVTDVNGCSNSNMVTVTVNTIPTPSILGDHNICNGESTVLDAGSFASYNWSTGETTQSIAVNPTVSTDYSITVTDVNGCSNSDLITVIVDQLPTPIITGNLNLCSGDSTILDVGNFETYSWSTGETSQTIVVSPSMSAAYAVTVSDVNGCTNSNLVTVTVNQPIVPIIVGDLTICSGENTTLDAGLFNTYEWSNGAITQTININPVVDTNYSVTTTDQNGCTATSSSMVMVSQIINPIIEGSTILCDNGSTILSLSEVYNSYQWSTGSTESQIEITDIGIYEVTVSNLDGCSETTTIEIQNDSNSTIQITQSNALCEGTTISLLAQQGFSSYLWNTGSTESQIDITEAGTYEVTVMTADGCSGFGQIEVVESEVNYSILKTDESCFGNCDGEIIFQIDSGYSILWDSGSTLTTEEELCPGIYPVQIFNVDGCSISTSIEILGAEEFTASIVADNTELTAQTQGGVAPFSYLWNTGETTQGIIAESGNFDVIITDANGCESTAQFIISGTIDHLLSSVKLFPNPVFDLLYIEFDEISTEQISYMIYSTDGRVIQKGNSLPKHLSVSNFDDGIYYFQLESSKGTYTKKIIVMH